MISSAGSIVTAKKGDWNQKEEEIALLVKLKQHVSDGLKNIQHQQRTIKGFTTTSLSVAASSTSSHHHQPKKQQQQQNSHAPSSSSSISNQGGFRIKTTVDKEYFGIVRGGREYTPGRRLQDSRKFSINSVGEGSSTGSALLPKAFGSGVTRNSIGSSSSHGSDGGVVVLSPGVNKNQQRPSSSSSSSFVAGGGGSRLRPMSLPRPRFGQKAAKPAPWTMAFLGEEMSKIPVHETDKQHPGGRVFLMTKR